MKISADKNKIKIYLWISLAYLLLWIFTELNNTPLIILQKVWNFIWQLGFILVFNFILFELTLPFIMKSWKRMFIAPFLLFAHIMLNTFGLYAWRLAGIEMHLYTEFIKYENTMLGVQNHAGFGIFSIFFFGILKHLYDYRKLKQTTQQLIIEKQAAELNFLKSQTNPHFLFNTLNNIYSLARDKSDLAPESILRLSKIMRYILYETGGEYIAIGQEIKIIENYISLEKLRYDESLHINFNYDIEDMKQSLPPLLLMPLIENAFKHGVSETRDNPYIDIHLSVSHRKLNLTVKNSIEQSQSILTENIGLSNLRRQLELLFKDYELIAKKDDSVFTAILLINLASHV